MGCWYCRSQFNSLCHNAGLWFLKNIYFHFYLKGTETESDHSSTRLLSKSPWTVRSPELNLGLTYVGGTQVLELPSSAPKCALTGSWVKKSGVTGTWTRHSDMQCTSPKWHINLRVNAYSTIRIFFRSSQIILNLAKAEHACPGGSLAQLFSTILLQLWWLPHSLPWLPALANCELGVLPEIFRTVCTSVEVCFTPVLGWFYRA